MANDILTLLSCSSVLAVGVYAGFFIVKGMDAVPWQVYAVLYSMVAAGVGCFCCLAVLVVRRMM